MNTNDKFVINLIIIRGCLLDLRKGIQVKPIFDIIDRAEASVLRLIDDEMDDPDKKEQHKRAQRIDKAVVRFREQELARIEGGADVTLTDPEKRLYLISIVLIILENLSELNDRKESVGELLTLGYAIENDLQRPQLNQYLILKDVNEFIEHLKITISAL